MRKLRDELDEFLDGFGAGANFFQRDDLAFFQNQQRFDVEHIAEQRLRFANASAAFEIIERLDEEADIDARNHSAH